MNDKLFDGLFSVSPKNIDEFNAFISNKNIMDNLSVGEQLLLLTAYGKFIEAVKPIMDLHKDDLVTYKITKVTKK